MRRAEAAAAAAREAVLAEIRAAKELSAADQAVGNHGGFTERLLGRLGKETKREQTAHDQEQEEEVPGGKVCARPAASFLMCWALGICGPLMNASAFDPSETSGVIRNQHDAGVYCIKLPFNAPKSTLSPYNTLHRQEGRKYSAGERFRAFRGPAVFNQPPDRAPYLVSSS